jgi:hypothetical protein
VRGTGTLAAAAWAFAAILAASPSRGQEQVRIQVPESVVFQVFDLQAKAAAPPSRLSFDHALLTSGSRLRISVRAEGLDLAGGPARIFFAAGNAYGGTGFSGSLREADYTPVFESGPCALSGGVEIAWSLAPLGRFDRAGARAVTLRWKVESLPGAVIPGSNARDLLNQTGPRTGPSTLQPASPSRQQGGSRPATPAGGSSPPPGSLLPEP